MVDTTIHTLTLLVFAIILMAVIAIQLKMIRGEAKAIRDLITRMDWGVMLFNNVQQLKAAVEALGIIEKRLQKLEEIQKVQLSNTNIGGIRR